MKRLYPQIPWIIYANFTLSLCTFTTVNKSSSQADYTYQTVSLNSESGSLFWVLFFTLLWTAEFIIAAGKLVVSTTVSLW